MACTATSPLLMCSMCIVHTLLLLFLFSNQTSLTKLPVITMGVPHLWEELGSVGVSSSIERLAASKFDTAELKGNGAKSNLVAALKVGGSPRHV